MQTIWKNVTKTIKEPVHKIAMKNMLSKHSAQGIITNKFVSGKKHRTNF